MQFPSKIFIPLIWLMATFSSFATSLSAADGKQNEQPLFIAVMGDSVALGVWADSRVGAPGPHFYANAATAQVESTLLSAFTGYKINDLSNAERYSTLIDHFFGYIARKPFSALIGKQAYSLPQRIKRATGKDVELVDTSFLAGCYRLSPIHLKRLREFMQKHPGHRAPDFIFINFTAMDFVFNSTIERFENDLHLFYATLAKEYPHATIVVNPLVDVVSSMSTSLDEVAVPGNLLMKPMTCADNYARVGFGAIIGIQKGVSDEHLAVLHEKLRAMNAIISTEVASLAAHVAPYDAFAGKALEIGPFEPPTGKWSDFLAADCIHPNIMGQKSYSDLIWEAVREYIVDPEGN